MVETPPDAVVEKEGNQEVAETPTKLSSWKMRRSRKDMIRIIWKGSIQKSRKSRMVLLDASLQNAVRYIL